MTEVEKILQLALSQVGVGEDPKGSSNNKFNQEYYGGKVNDPKLDWCVVFIWWNFRHAGIPNLFYGGGKTASCSTFYHYHQQQEVSWEDAQPGDIVLFDWSGKKKATQHIGFILHKKGDLLSTVEGNTGNAASGEVQVRDRDRKWVSHIIRPMYQVAQDEQTAYERIFHSLDEVPDWAKKAVQWGILEGFVNTPLNLYESNLQVLTWMYRRENHAK